MVIASFVSRSMLDTLELRERLKEFSRLSVAAAVKHRSTAQAEAMQEERDVKRWQNRKGEKEKTRKRKAELQKSRRQVAMWWTNKKEWWCERTSS